MSAARSGPIRLRAALLAAAALFPMLVGCIASRRPSSDPAALPALDAYVPRLEALAALQTLNVELLTNDSATLTLERWCAAHGLADPARVTADRDRATDKPPTALQRELLGVGPAERGGYRRVKLRCGRYVLSEADNWYVPSRLTPAMNAALDTSDVAFGRAVQALGYTRLRLGALLLWAALPPDWASTPRPAIAPTGPLDIPRELLRHSAVLKLADGRAISLVDETYTGDVLAFLARRQDPAPR